MDDGFTDFHRPILIHLGALMNRDFQKKRIIHRTSAGHQMEVTAGGVATIKGIKVIKDDAGVPIQIIGPVDRVPEMKRIAQSLGLSFKFEEVPYNVLAPEAVLEVARGFDNAMHPRGAAKALLEMIDYADQNRLLAPAKLPLRLARTQAFAAVRDFVRNGRFNGHLTRLTPYVIDLRGELAAIFGHTQDEDFFNRLVIGFDAPSRQVIGVLQIAEAMPWIVKLADDVEVESSFSLKYARCLTDATKHVAPVFVPDTLISPKLVERVRFSARTQHAVDFALEKVFEARREAVGRAALLVDHRRDDIMADTLRVQLAHFASKHGSDPRRAVAESLVAPLARRFMGTRPPDHHGWRQLVERVSAETALDCGTFANHATSKTLTTETAKPLIGEFRRLIDATVEELGLPNYDVPLPGDDQADVATSGAQ